MKVSLNWLREFTDIKLSVEELVEKIGAQLGAVEEVVYLGEKYKGIVAAKVVSCVSHPNADKLNVCLVDDGGVVKGVKRDAKGLVQVVCGAPNVKAGMIVAWLPPGTVVPATIDKDPMTLDVREIRGQLSNGMLASPKELAMGDDHSGILEIDQPAKPGQPLAEIYKLDDYIIDIENKMFTHRPDCFGILGVAREVAGIQQHKFVSPKWYSADKTASPGNSQELVIKNEIPKLVPRFMAQVIENVSVGPSPIQLQSYLSRVGIRPINNIVDATNYLMYLTGQPLHAYDADKLRAEGKKNSIVVRQGKEGEKLTLLGGKTIELRKSDIVIASADKPIGLGGVMGGSETEVDETTKNIILECATFDMYSIRRTAMAHGLFTDAVTRFTKGQSALQNDRVLYRAVEEIVSNAGGTAGLGVHDAHKGLPSLQAVKVTPAFINDRLGLSLSADKVARLLENVEFKVMRLAGGSLGITPPFWRTDIEIAEDIVEEVGRLYGFDHLPLKLPSRSIKPAGINPELAIKSRVRNVLSRLGCNEALTYTFVHGNLIEKVGQDKSLAFELNNALSPDLQYYRLSLTPSLLDKVHANIKAGYQEFALFEIGKKHQKGLKDAEGLPLESDVLSLVFAADSKTAAAKYGGAAYYQARKYLEELCFELGLEPEFVTIQSYNKDNQALPQWLKPFDQTRSSVVIINNEAVGVVGEYNQKARRALKLPTFCAGFEIGLHYLKVHAGRRAYKPLPTFPKVMQDLTLKVAANLPAGELISLAKEMLQNDAALGKINAAVAPIDIYQAEGEDTKNITLRLTVASYERTLTDQEVGKLLDTIAAKSQEALNSERI